MSRRSLDPVHRVRRFAASLRPGSPDAAQLRWAHDQLSVGERQLFDAMTPGDQAHSIGVARAVQRHPRAGSDWMVVAALTHDVGKGAAPMGIVGRVVATLLGAVGASRWAPRWRRRRGWTGMLGRYLMYPELGARLLDEAGADPRVVAWAAQHHSSEGDWTVPLADGRILAAADDGRLSVED